MSVLWMEIFHITDTEIWFVQEQRKPLMDKWENDLRINLYAMKDILQQSYLSLQLHKSIMSIYNIYTSEVSHK